MMGSLMACSSEFADECGIACHDSKAAEAKREKDEIEHGAFSRITSTEIVAPICIKAR